MGHMTWRRVLLAGALVGAMVAAIACSGGGASEADLTAAQSQLKDAQSQLTAAQSQLSSTQGQLTTAQNQVKALQDQISNTSPVMVVQAGQLQPIPVNAQPSGWDTDESIKGGLHLVATYDSSGPDAWDPKAHPLVYIASDGTENESPLYDKNAAYFAGFDIIDAMTKEVITSVSLNVGQEINRFPHGFGTSMDGKWGYVGWGQKRADGNGNEGVVAIVNMRTLKIDKLLKQESPYQFGMRSQNLHHIQSWIDSQGNSRVILQWGFGSNGGPHHVLDPNDDNRVVKSITYDDVRPMGHPFTTPSPDGKYLYISMDSPEITRMEYPAAGIAKINTENWSITIIPAVGHHLIGIVHTQDGKYTYVADAEVSQVVKIDDETNEVVGRTSAGVAGPYGLAFNWDETRLYTVGKGEGSHNMGGVLGVVDTKLFRQARDVSHEMPIWLGASASSVDHAALHPDPAVNELWVSNMNGWDTIVLDLKTNTVKAHIPTAMGGNTHGMAFVKYNADWTGELQSDMGGPKSASMKAAVRAAVAAAQ